MTQTIAFHSYKGGTGKTTIAANLSAMFALQGYKVALLDLDVYAPSLQTYFAISPQKWINNVLLDKGDAKDVLLDMTPVIADIAGNPSSKIGKLWAGFSNPEKEEIYRLEGNMEAGRQQKDSLGALRKFIQFREAIISQFDLDYVILDTSPGIRYWSINSLAIADVLLLTLKFGELDIVGTKKLASDIFRAFAKFGAKPRLLLNRVSGYCRPNTLITNIPHAGQHMYRIPQPDDDVNEVGKTLSKEVSMELLASVPCYCDIQFSKREFLTALQYSSHPFSKQIENLASQLRK